MGVKIKTVTVFGGTGFIGSQVVRELAGKGYVVKIATRVPERAYFLKPCGAVGQVVPVACHYDDQKAIDAVIQGSDYVVNSIGVLFEKKKGGFDKVHHQLPKMIAKACQKYGVKRFVHISALGVDKATSRYAASKVAGEAAVIKNFSQAAIIRPSVVFGPEDEFFNMFAGLARVMPALPLIGGGKTKFQPVYVGDVCDAVVKILTGSKMLSGKIYELGGPEVVSFRDIYKRLFDHIHCKKMLVTVPWCVAKIQASFMSLMPKPLLTRDQVETLKTDNVVSGDMAGFKDLGIEPTAMELILPLYLETYINGGKFADHG